MPSFSQTLADHGLHLTRDQTHTLQVNVGLLCNQTCRHCHLKAGHRRPEIMDQSTIVEVADYARRGGFTTVDITGGAPELNPHLEKLIDLVRPAAQTVMLRANLTALTEAGREDLLDYLAANQVVIVGSLPSLNASQADAQRGQGVFERSIFALRRLNKLGYGTKGSGLELNLVSNPAGAFLPPGQSQAEKRFKNDLGRRYGIRFNNLYAFANAPLGRFKDWLYASGNYDGYVAKLAGAFNPCAAEKVMCRSLVSVAWDGYLYDCDFNLALGLPLAGRKTHVRSMEGPPRPGDPIAVAEHCYTCTAGAGFT